MIIPRRFFVKTTQPLAARALEAITFVALSVTTDVFGSVVSEEFAYFCANAFDRSGGGGLSRRVAYALRQ